MSLWDEDKDGFGFSTRDGVPTGHANERTMLDAIGGGNQIRTKIITNPDGGTTMLRTRGGFPTFITETVKELVNTVKGGLFLYYKLASDVHPFGWGKLNSGKMTGRWQWPGRPVSYSEITANPTSLSPVAFDNDDGPGTMTWEDTRGDNARQTNAVLSWSPAFGNGRAAPTAYMAGNLNSVWPSSPHHNYAFDGGTESEEPGRSLPGQKMPGGAGGHLRFVQYPGETELYEDGKKVGVYGYILAACIVTGKSERWRTIEFAPRETANAELVLKAKGYRADGTFAGSATISMSLPGYVKFEEMIQPPRFNSSGTVAVGIIRYSKADGGAIEVIVIDWENATANIGAHKADYYTNWNFQYGSDPGQFDTLFYGGAPGVDRPYDLTVSSQTVVPIAVDYVGDTISLLWTKYTYSSEDHRSVTLIDGGGTSASMSGSQNTTFNGAMSLYLNDSEIKSVSFHNSMERSDSYTDIRVVPDPDRPWIIRRSAGASVGQWTKTYSPGSAFITDVMADLRKGIVAYCVESIGNYSTTVEASAATAFYPFGSSSPTSVTRSISRHTPAVMQTVTVELYNNGQTSQVISNSGVIEAAVDYENTSTSTTYSSLALAAPVPEYYGADDSKYNGWSLSGRPLNSSFVDSLSLAVNKTGEYVFVSGLLSNGLAKVFTPFAKMIVNGAVENVSLNAVPSDEGQPGYTWVSEPIFLDVEVTP